MNMSGEQQIPASREQVWKALNNPKVLRKCIPGCEALDQTSPTKMVATIRIKVGPLSRKFKSEVSLENINEPTSFTIVTQGGMGKANTDVRLREEAGETVVSYAIQAKIASKIAILGAGLVKPAAKRIMAQFFDKLKKVIAFQMKKNQPSEPSEA
jgi:carbon monoxide dehydrogenase subunit G